MVPCSPGGGTRSTRGPVAAVQKEMHAVSSLRGQATPSALSPELPFGPGSRLRRLRAAPELGAGPTVGSDVGVVGADAQPGAPPLPSS